MSGVTHDEVRRLDSKFRDFNAALERYRHMQRAIQARLESPKVKISVDGRDELVVIPMDTVVSIVRSEVDVAVRGVEQCGGRITEAIDPVGKQEPARVPLAAIVPEGGIFNKWGVAAAGDHIALMIPPARGQRMSKEEAVQLAAWIVAVADPSEELFHGLLEQVMS